MATHPNTHSSILAWRIPWTEESGGLQSMGSQRVGHNLATKQQQQSSRGFKRKRGRERGREFSGIGLVKKGSWKRWLWKVQLDESGEGRSHCRPVKP